MTEDHAVSDELVPTAVAAKAIGVDSRTLQRWVRQGRVTPELVTAGGQARWDVDKLKQQLRDQRKRSE